MSLFQYENVEKSKIWYILTHPTIIVYGILYSKVGLVPLKSGTIKSVERYKCFSLNDRTLSNRPID